MANIELLPYAQQVAAIERQRKLASLMQEQGMQPSTTQMVSGIAVPTSPWETASKLAQSLASAYSQSRSDKQEAALEKQQREEAKKAIQDFMAASGPQKTVTQTPVMEQDFGQAATPEDYQNMMNDPQMGLAPKRRDVSQAATPEDVQDIVNQPYVTQDVTSYKPGLSRNEQIAKLLEMQAGGNKYVSAAVPTLTGLVSQQEEYGTPFESGGKMYAMTKQGTIKDLGLSASTKTANLQRDKRTFIGKGGVEYTQDIVFDPTTGTSKDVGEAYISKPASKDTSTQETYGALTSVVDPATGKTVYVRPGSKGGIKAVTEYTPPAAQAPEAFHEKNLDLTTASDNFSNFRTVLNTIDKAGGIYGESAGQLASAFKLAQNSIRKLQGTGVLNIGELPFLEQALNDPQGLKSLADPTSRQKILGQLDQLDKALQRQRTALFAEYKQPLTEDKTTATPPSSETAAQRAKRLGL